MKVRVTDNTGVEEFASVGEVFKLVGSRSDGVVILSSEIGDFNIPLDQIQEVDITEAYKILNFKKEQEELLTKGKLLGKRIVKEQGLDELTNEEFMIVQPYSDDQALVYQRYENHNDDMEESVLLAGTCVVLDKKQGVLIPVEEGE
ncbi:hypothetical protein [Listeria fleischmannii]|uniref:Uncharacterized protein n=1 Tax=Listeria fleischmannii FSL S10-1203 TaxID=1265822 RepID=W7E2G9_9LIST|nr:hypothetical protein [Listeria fleischmannii]EUJ64828.1 hypothetical protein MCOL2_01475 [Listeria fleischmannii FSL S10-1203]